MSAAAAVVVNSGSTAPADARRQRLATRALRGAAAVWLGSALTGQLAFAIYVAGFYGRAAAQGRPERWNEVLPHGYVSGETFLNLVLALHLAFAVAVVVAGALQLISYVRRRWPALHRWTGRAYVVAVASVAAGGLVLVWTRGAAGDFSQHVAISLNAIVILIFAAIAWRRARSRRIDSHRRWALRLFLATSGVWFFRIGLMLWIVANQGPAGFDPKTFAGPFLTFLAFAQYVVPLAVLELYFLAQTRGGPRARLAMAAALAALTLPTIAGIAAAAGILWLPRLA